SIWMPGASPELLSYRRRFRHAGLPKSSRPAEMTSEEIHPPPLRVAFLAGPVVASGHGKELEVLVSRDEGIDHLIGGRRVHVRIDFADGEKQGALEFGGMGDVRVVPVVGTDGPTHPLLVPPDLVHAVVVAAAVRCGRLV